MEPYGRRVNTGRGAALASRHFTARATVQRKATDGWHTVGLVSCGITATDASAAGLAPDAADATTSATLVWIVAVPIGTTIRAHDRLVGVALDDGRALPTLSIVRDVTSYGRSSWEFVAVAEAAGTADEWVTFWRYNQTTDTSSEHGPYPVSVAWEGIQPRDVAPFGAGARLALANITGAADMDVLVGDVVESLQGYRAGEVIAVAAPVADRKTATVRVDIGVVS